VKIRLSVDRFEGERDPGRGTTGSDWFRPETSCDYRQFTPRQTSGGWPTPIWPPSSTPGIDSLAVRRDRGDGPRFRGGGR